MIELVLSAALKGTVPLAAAWIATRLLRHSSADLRHRIWLAALADVALLLIPAPLPEPMRIVVSNRLDTAYVAQDAAQSAPGLTPLWFAGVALVLLHFLIGVIRLAWLTHRAHLGGETRVSDHVSSPLTWGMLRPAILLPTYAADWPAEKLAVVLAHERTHIARRDWLWQSCAQLLTAVFWFHPLMWLAAARLRQEAEQATDDRVLAGGADPADYAERLMEVARQVRARVPHAAVAVTMVRSSALTARIGAILDTTRSRASTRRWLRMTIAIGTAACALLLAACAGSRVYRIGGGVQAPVPIQKTEPEYSITARVARLQGAVLLDTVINAEGKAEQIRVVRSLEPGGLDENAIASIKQWTFQPARKDGKPVAVRARIEVKFRLL